MKNQVLLALLVLALAALACGVPGRQAGAPAAASPTPPPIPTALPVTPTPQTEEGTSSSGSGGPAAPSGQPMRIIYGSARDGKMGLYLLSLDGRFTSEITLEDEAITNAIWPEVSPDGQQIVFVSVQSNFFSNGIYIADLDGSEVRQITVGDGFYPAWSPDGTRLAYACNDNTDICVVNVEDGTTINLTGAQPPTPEEQEAEPTPVEAPEEEEGEDNPVDTYPDWTEDGRIVFMSDRGLAETGRYSEIYIMNADGSDVTVLTADEEAYNAHPRVSPDGTQITFESDREVASGSEIYIMDIDGSNQARITNDSVWNQNPVWSPDGNVILFASNYGDGNIDLYYINTDGSNRVRLTQHPGEDGGLRWGHNWLAEEYFVTNAEAEVNPREQISLPEGSEAVTNAIIFATNSFNCPDCLETGIYTVGFDGSNLTRLPLEGVYPAWGPDFERIAFVQNGEVFIANADGSEPTQLTKGYRGLYGINWHEDPDLILAGCTPYEQHDVCLVNPTTGSINNIMEEITYGLGIPYPTWFNDQSILIGTFQVDLNGDVISTLPFSGKVSPTTTRLATIIDRQLTVMGLDGTDRQTLTSDAPTKGFPIWSPDEQLIIYSVAPGDGRVYLYVVEADGENPRALVARPIAAGPTSRPDTLNIYYGYNWGQ